MTEEFLELNLTVKIVCLDCDFTSQKKKKIRLGNCFNLEGDLILKETEGIYFCNNACEGSRNLLFIDLKRLF